MERGAGSARIMDVDADTSALDGSGRFYLLRGRLPSSVTVKRGKSWLLAASALASSPLGVAEPALALNECEALATSGSATCTSAPRHSLLPSAAPIPTASRALSPYLAT